MPKFQNIVLWGEKQWVFRGSLTCVSMGGLFSGVRPLKVAVLGSDAFIVLHFALKSTSHHLFELFYMVQMSCIDSNNYFDAPNAYLFN